MTVEEPKRAVDTGSKRFNVRDSARSVITRKPCHLPLNQSMSRRWLGCEEEAPSQQIELGAAKHLALEQLQAIDLPFDGALTPGQRDPGLHGGIIGTSSFGKAPEGRESALGGTRQPGGELGRLALADEAGEVLCEHDGLRQFE
jgi:hypothetical protein